MREWLKDTPIQRKLILIIILTSAVAMLLMAGTFFIYEFVTFRQATVRQLSTLGEVIADNSAAALAFENPNDAREVLAALKAEHYIVAAALYDEHGKLFATYPAELPLATLPVAPGADGYRFGPGHLAGFQPVVRRGKRLGTLYLKFETGTVTSESLRVSLATALAVIAVILAVTYALSRLLQRQISRPIVALADMARTVSERRDYSVRATKVGNDELGLLTDAFNQMLTRIQESDASLRASEARFRPLFSNNPNPMWAYELATLAFLEVNEAAIGKYGYSREEFLGMTIKDIRPEADQSRLLEDIAQARPAYQTSGEWRHRLKDGRVIDVEIVSHTMELSSRLVALVVVHDITDRKKADASVQRLNAELEQRVRGRTAELEAANQELEAFTYTVSHDLRAPLRAITGFANLAVEKFAPQLPDKGRHYLNVIREDAQRMGELIDDLLSFSRLGRQRLEKRSVDTAQLVNECLGELEAMRAGRQVEIRLGPLPACEADRSLLKQVWLNLLGNALKYTRRREHAVIEIDCTQERGGDIFRVRDNGAGFDMRYAHKLFGVFQRLHRTEEFEGTGVGLAIVQRMVARHGGRIWVEAAVDRGATFFFTLTGEPNDEPK